MSMAPDPIGQAGLQYFGRTAASVSHELKNALAIIRENAGLLNDYLLMADKGMPVDPMRFKTVAARIEGQVARADGIIKNMNRFAHSIDDPLKSVDLQEILALFVQLSLREASMRQVSLSVAQADTPAMIRTAPFLLLTILGRCLSYALQAAAPGQKLTVLAERSGESVRIRFERLPGLPDMPDGAFPRESERDLLAALNATFAADAAAGHISITLSNR